MKKVLCLLLAVGFAMGFMYGCDDSDYSPAAVTTTTVPAATVTVNGKIILGAVNGATVFLDYRMGTAAELNNYGANDYPTTAAVMSGADGSYTIPGVPQSLDVTKYLLVAKGGKDVLTGKKNGLLLAKLPANFMTVSSLTVNLTALSTMAALNPGLEDTLKAAVGGNLGDFDPENATPEALAIEKAISTTLQSLTDDLTTDSATDVSSLLNADDSAAVNTVLQEFANNMQAEIDTLGTGATTAQKVALVSTGSTLANIVDKSVKSTNVQSSFQGNMTGDQISNIAGGISKSVNTISNVIVETGATNETILQQNAVVQSAQQDATNTIDNTANDTVIPAEPEITIASVGVMDNAGATLYTLTDGGTANVSNADADDDADNTATIMLDFDAANIDADMNMTGKSFTVNVAGQASPRKISLRITGLSISAAADATDPSIALTDASQIIVNGTAWDGVTKVSATVTQNLTQYIEVMDDMITIYWDELKAAADSMTDGNMGKLHDFNTISTFAVSVTTSTCAEFVAFGGTVTVAP